MDLNLAFDDGDLESTKDRQKSGDHNLPYNVKLCTPEWFACWPSSNTNSNAATSESKVKQVVPDTEHLYQIIKFKADLHYHKKQFSKAAVEYEAALDVLPQNNVSVRQDMRESLCRCYVNCGLSEKSLELARNLVAELANEDEARQRQSLILLSSVCEKAERWAECVDTLERYCHLQPYFAQTWAKLGDALLKVNEESGDKIVEATDKKQNWIKALTCYVRARFLCDLCLGTASELVKERDKHFIEKMTEKIDLLPLSKGEKDFANKFIPRDSESVMAGVTKDQFTNVATDGKQPSISNAELFYKRFCSWYEAYQNQESTESEKCDRS